MERIHEGYFNTKGKLRNGITPGSSSASQTPSKVHLINNSDFIAIERGEERIAREDKVTVSINKRI